MGSARWSDSDWAVHATAASAKTREQIYTARSMDPALDPSKIKYRESVDSAVNPECTPIILASDVTGSMGAIAERMIKEWLGKIMGAIYEQKPITDPHIMCMAIGDATVDRAPLQVTQFEAGVSPLVEQLAKVWIEAGGGANEGESYNLAWWFAAYKCRCDNLTKRGRKGFLFTIGDEAPLDVIQRDAVRSFMGVGCQADIPTTGLLEVVRKGWHVFHLMVKPVDNQDVKGRWSALLGQHAISIPKLEHMAEGIVAIIAMIQGKEVEEAAKHYTGETKIVVRDIGRQLVGA